MKIFDGFIYNNEDLILDIRLHTLCDYVEKFIIVEAAYDHQGNKKKLNFSFEKFKKFENKIIYKIIEKFPNNLSNWGRENFQRNYISNGLEEARDEDYVIISDVDEIPNLMNIKNIDKFKFTAFKQKLFYYKLNLINQSEPFWFGSKMCKKKYLIYPQWLRKQKVKKYPLWRFFKIKWNIIDQGGWHFSFLMTAKQIKKKLSSYAHAEYNNNYFKDLKKINSSIEKGEDLFDRKFKFQKITLDYDFPKYITDNKSNFSQWIA